MRNWFLYLLFKQREKSYELRHTEVQKTERAATEARRRALSLWADVYSRGKFR